MGHKWGLPQKLKRLNPSRSLLDNIIFRKYLRQTLVGGLFYACQAFAFFGISIFLPILLQSMHVTDQKFLALSIMAVCSLGYFLNFNF